jgi:hypothetical protein
MRLRSIVLALAAGVFFLLLLALSDLLTPPSPFMGSIRPSSPSPFPQSTRSSALLPSQSPQSTRPSAPLPSPSPQSTRPSASTPEVATSTAPAQTGKQVPLPDFPWPPPEPSEKLLLNDAIFRTPSATATSLAAIGEKITSALRQADYLEYSFYRAPNGFALVARLERISSDGFPLPTDFRYIPPDADEPFSFAGYIRSLFFAPEGFYRLIAFVVTDRPFVTAAEGMDARRAQTLLSGGANDLPEQLRTEAFTQAHKVTALIYEFRKGSRAGDVAAIIPGRLAAATHLQRARIEQYLRPSQ